MKKRLALITGITIGILGVLMQVAFRVYSPEVYGICLACHGKDLVTYIFSFISAKVFNAGHNIAAFPLLTPLGVLLGARIAALRHREYRPDRVDHPLKAGVLGALVMVSALLVASCPIRLTLRVGYGDRTAVLALICMILGIAITTIYLKRRVTS